MSMLPTDHVAQIKRYLQVGYRVGEISDAYGVSRHAVANIKWGKTYPRVLPARRVPALETTAAKVLAEIHADPGLDEYL